MRVPKICPIFSLNFPLCSRLSLPTFFQILNHNYIKVNMMLSFMVTIIVYDGHHDRDSGICRGLPIVSGLDLLPCVKLFRLMVYCWNGCNDNWSHALPIWSSSYVRGLRKEYSLGVNGIKVWCMPLAVPQRDTTSATKNINLHIWRFSIKSNTFILKADRRDTYRGFILW